jgi:tetratricopeptide (TPR) repeat protein
MFQSRMRLGLMLAALAALALPTRPDDIILHSGEVVEGKLDQEATAKANKGITDQGRMVMVFIVDEKGTRKSYPYKDVKYVHPKKTSWEQRREAEAWYARQKPKDTVASQESIARQCKSKKLDDLAQKHYAKAYELRKESIAKKEKREPSDHIALANWCHKIGLAAEEREQWKEAYLIKKKEMGDELTSAKQCLELAEWCRKADLVDEAMALYEEALVIEPANAVAKKTIGDLKNTIEYKLRAMVAEYEKAKRGWRLTIAIEDNVDAAFLDEWKTKMESLSNFIFEVTEGQFFISEVKIEDDTSNGRIIIEKGKKDWYGMNSKQPAGILAYCKMSGTPQWEVHAPGKAWESVLCHEMFHGIFGLLDEYYQNPQCPCIMRAAPNPQKICNPQTHLGGGRQKEPCWDTIKRRYADVVSPNPKWKYTKEGIRGPNRLSAEEVDGELDWNGIKANKPPPTKVILVDN